MMDGQAVYPSWVVAGPLEAFSKWYLNFLRDPIMTGVFNADPVMRFMMPFFYLEMFFQLPCFILGAIGLWKSESPCPRRRRARALLRQALSRAWRWRASRAASRRCGSPRVWTATLTTDDKRVWPLLVAYGASTATTLLPVLQGLLFDTKTNPPLTTVEFAGLMSCYLPYLGIPLMMAVDLGFRIAKLLGGGTRKKV